MTDIRSGDVCALTVKARHVSSETGLALIEYFNCQDMIRELLAERDEMSRDLRLLVSGGVLGFYASFIVIYLWGI